MTVTRTPEPQGGNQGPREAGGNPEPAPEPQQASSEPEVQQSEPAAPPVADEKGVPYFNRYRESQRKMENLEDLHRREMAERDKQIADTQARYQQFLMQQGNPQPAPASGNPFGQPQPQPSPQPQAPQPQPGGQRYLTPEELDARFQAFQNQQRYEGQMNSARSTAEGRYEDLKNSSSEFYREVDLELSRQQREYLNSGQTPPANLVLHVANEVALSGRVKTSNRSDTEDITRDRMADRMSDSPPPTQPAPTPSKADVSQVPRSVIERWKRATGKDEAAFAERLKENPKHARDLKTLKDGGWN